MDLRNYVAALALASAALGGCAAFDPGPPPLTRDELVLFAKSGEAPAAMVERLRKTRTVLALSASDILQLSAEGVPREVLDYLQAAQINELRQRDQFNRMLYGPEMGPFSRCAGYGRARFNRFGSPFWPYC